MNDSKGADQTLWCVHIPGPDDLYAWPTREMAEDHARRLNACIRRFWEREPRTEYDPSEESMTAVVIPWPWDAEGHTEDAIRNVKAECRGNA